MQTIASAAASNSRCTLGVLSDHQTRVLENAQAVVLSQATDPRHNHHGRQSGAAVILRIPEVPPEKLAQPTGHHIRDGHRVIAAPILAGLHHEYRLEPLAA